MFSAKSRAPWTSTTPRFTITSISVPSCELRGAAHLEPAGLERDVPGDAALAAAQQPAAELRQVEVERDALVVEQELAAHDHEPLDRDAEPAAAAAAAAELRDVVAAGTERGRGKGVDAQPHALEAHARQHDAVAAPGRDARAHAHRGDLEERRRIGRDAADAQAAELELAGREPQAEATARVTGRLKARDERRSR